MTERLNYIWRVFATALAFSAFGLGGLILRMSVFPLLALCVRQDEQRKRLARLVVHHSFRSFIALARVLGLLSYEITGQTRLRRKGLLVLANHPTLIDVVFLISLIPDADCVVKPALKRNPFTRSPISACAYICKDSGIGFVDDCIQSIKCGHNLVIFPEGTRTPLDGTLTLQRGAANIALRGPCDITPVHIRCEPRSLAKGQRWWRIPPRPMHFTIEVLNDIPIADFCQGANESLAARTLTRFLQEMFSEKQ